ncbi:MAG: Gx transporter family protein [Ruminococcus sp.]|jgi:heptaprenyl diphosphate synthase|nr:Gx transporter family protein [Ruminococcus sp.]
MQKPLSYKIALTGILTALTIVLSIAETLIIGAIPGVPPGVRLGLSNVCIMAAIVLLSTKAALPIVLCKSLFVMFTRGFTAGIMAFAGTFAAFIVMALMIAFTKRSFIFICVIAAVSHIFAQILTACILTESFYTLYYLPVPLLTAVITGVITGAVFTETIKKLDFVGKI